MKIKYFAAYAILILLMAASCGENSPAVKPPKSIVASFESRFGAELKPQWKITGQAGYVAGFRRNGQPIAVYFDGNGNWLKTESEIISSELPVVVVKTISGGFNGSSIHKALKVEKAGGETTYILSLKSGSRISKMELTSDGVIIGNLQ